MNPRLPLWIALAAVLSAPAWTRLVHPDRYEGGRSRDEVARVQRNTSSVAMLMGQLRTSLNDVLFLKTENYLHSGVEYAPHLGDQKIRSVSEEGTEAAAHQQEVPKVYRDEKGNEILVEEHQHAPLLPTIRTPDRDFRGWIGHLHREVKPWRSPDMPHVHTSGTELLPWFRVMTVHDPHYVRGYATGAYWLMQKDADQAILFAREAVGNNPGSFQAHLTLGEAHYHKAREMPGADVFNPAPEVRAELELARQAYRNAFACVEKERPVDLTLLPEEHPWRLWMDTDAMRATQMAALLEKQVGDPAEAVRLAARGLKFYPENSSLRRIAGAPPAPRKTP